MKKFVLSPQYEGRLRAIEDFIFLSIGDIRLVDRFLDDHDEALKFIESNPNAAAIHPETGDRSWPFGSGRYRIFFLVAANQILLTGYHRQSSDKSWRLSRQLITHVRNRRVTIGITYNRHHQQSSDESPEQTRHKIGFPLSCSPTFIPINIHKCYFAAL